MLSVVSCQRRTQQADFVVLQRRAGISKEQRRRLWQVWEARCWRLQELDLQHAQIQEHLVGLLDSLQLSGDVSDGSADYLGLLDAGASLISL